MRPNQLKVSAKSAMYAKHAQLMQARSQNYFDVPSLEVLSLIPEDVERVLEVGCGGGATLRTLKERRTTQGRICEVVGVDIEADAVARGREYLDAVYLMDAEEDELTEYSEGYFDLLIMQYVLEHVVNPWDTLRRWLPLVRPGGYVIVGVPNIANYKFLRRLIFDDEFAHEPAGILDWTHLRYFTGRSLTKLLTDADLKIMTFMGLPSEEQMNRKMRYFLRMAPNFRRFAYSVYIVLARKDSNALVPDYVPFEETYTL
jgi:SAM-dependent methyltransferase